MSDKTLTAIHEAGHAVAHVRLGIQQSFLTIKPYDGLAGSYTAEGENHVWSKEEAVDQVLAFCAGYATLAAHGCDEEEAQAGDSAPSLQTGADTGDPGQGLRRTGNCF